MKKNLVNKYNGSIRELMNHISIDMFTKETLVSLFRAILETIIESRYKAIILIKINNVQSFQGLINRLKYSESKVYIYTDLVDDVNFTKIQKTEQLSQNDEFIIVLDDSFSASLFWDETTADVFGLCQGFCTLNPYDARQIAEYLQTLAYDKSLDESLTALKYDRRRNEVFTSILKKLVSSIDSRQRDLICMNAEVQELYEKNLQGEKLVALGQLCSTIAHELRNPLGMIDLYAKILSKNVEKSADEISDEKTRETLLNSASTISKASLNLEKILTDLLDYSKPLTLEKSENDLNETVEEVVNLIRPLYEEKKVELIYNYRLDKHIKLMYDKFKLNQAILNLLKNALEVSKENTSVEISIEARTGDNKVFVKVKDQGKGIRAEDKEKIFTPYFTTKKEGSGLGLAQSRKILEAHNGNLFIISTGQRGTIFGLSLPLNSQK